MQRKDVPQTVAQVDLSRYSGKWFEIARLPNSFEKGCDCATAEYAVRPDNSVAVKNTCFKADGESYSVRAVAYKRDPGGAKLGVSFAPGWLKALTGRLTEGKYWVLYVDPNYQRALVGSPNRKYLWILGREPRLPRPELEQLLTIAQEQGYDTSRLYYTQCATMALASGTTETPSTGTEQEGNQLN